MTTTINGRTPEEIKKALRICSGKLLDYCDACNYCNWSSDCACNSRMCADALEYIQRLERERDAAVKQLRKGGRACSTCKFSEDIPENDKICEECRLTGTKLLYSNWEWVGPQEVE